MVNIDPPTLRRLGEIANITHQEASWNIAQMTQVIQKSGNSSCFR